MLWISSCMITVFQTPAPPKSPTFPHFSIGAIRSITLIPVSKTSALFARFLNSGAALWIGSINSAFGAGRSSMGSQRTLNIRPRTFAPVGILIGDSVATTSNHLLSPSTGFIAIVLTTLSQSCCCTSKITL